MATIYRKTAKGSAEIDTRAHRLTPRLRGMLIVVDGKRSDADLLAMLPHQGAETLLALKAGGFVEPMNAPPAYGGAAADARPPVLRGLAPPAPPHPPETAPGQLSTLTGTLPPGVDFRTLRRSAVRALSDQIGPMAEALAIKMESTHNVSELAPLLETAAQIVGNVRGDTAAEQYRRRYGVS